MWSNLVSKSELNRCITSNWMHSPRGMRLERPWWLVQTNEGPSRSRSTHQGQKNRLPSFGWRNLQLSTTLTWLGETSWWPRPWCTRTRLHSSCCVVWILSWGIDWVQTSWQTMHVTGTWPPLKWPRQNINCLLESRNGPAKGHYKTNANPNTN